MSPLFDIFRALLILSLLVSSSRAADTIRVELNDGRTFTGRPVSFRDDIVVLRSQLDGGEVERGFPKGTIARLHFPHSEIVARAIESVDDGRLIEALPHLEAIWRQRAPFLTLLDMEIIELLTSLPSAHLEAGDPYRAINLAQRLLPHVGTPESANRIHESILFGHYQLEFYEEVETLARKWIHQQPEFPTSALGWKILGDLALREENFERLSWITLQPIALAGPQPMKHLNGCYALAIHAFHKQEQHDRAAQLHREMIERGLLWPGDKVLKDTGEFYQSLAKDRAGNKTTAVEPDLDLRPPEEDLNLPIRQVRKILRAEDS